MIDKTAYIGDKVKLGKNVSIGRYSIIDGDVEIGDNTTISHFCCIGTPAQTVPNDYVGKIIIGKNNVIREYVSINLPAKDVTKIGNENLIMCGINIGHDIKIGNNTVICVGAQLGGHSVVGDYVKLGLNSCVHQFVKIGAHSMIGMGSQVRLDVPPFSVVENAKVGFDFIGLKRFGNGYKISEVKKAYFKYKKDSLNFNPDEYSDKIRSVYKKFLNEEGE